MMKTPFESSAMLDRGGKPTVRELLSSMVFNPVDGTIRMNGDRLVMQRAAVGVELRRELIRVLGPEEARVFLIRLGYLCGQADARFVRSAWPNLNVGDAFTAGTRLHMFSGVVRVETVHNDFDFRKKRFSGEFLWHDSVEAVEGRNHQLPATGAVCWTQTGYASGYASEFFDTLIVYKEIACAAEGHRCCRVLGKPAETWGMQDAEVVLFRDRIVGHGGAAPLARRPVPTRRSDADLTALDEIILAPVRASLDRLSRTTLPALICGPAGSGRRRAAQYLHRATGGLVPDFRQIAAVQQTPDTIAASCAGPARQGRRDGAMETIVFDDIEQMPFHAQARLATIIEDGLAMGSPRIIALSTRQPDALAMDPAMNPQLWFALAALPVVMPALGDRADGGLTIARAMLPMLSDRLGRGAVALSQDAAEHIALSAWPGNIGELRATLTAVLADLPEGEPVTATRIAAHQARLGRSRAQPGRGDAGFATWLDAAFGLGGINMEAIERTIQEAAVSRSGGNLSAAARLLGLTRAQLAYRIRAGNRPEDAGAEVEAGLT